MARHAPPVVMFAVVSASLAARSSGELAGFELYDRTPPDRRASDDNEAAAGTSGPIE